MSENINETNKSTSTSQNQNAKASQNVNKNGVFGKKMTRQEWKQYSLKRNQMAILNKKTPFVIREAYKTARTNIIFAVSGTDNKECKTIIVTSSNTSEGKTTSSLNLAITFSQTGARVLIIDGDMRKPRVHQYMGLVKDNGLSTVLSKQKTFDEVVFRNVRDGLDLLASGAIPPNPAELLGSEAMENLLSELKSQYDYIFIDTPPVSLVTDAATISRFSSGAILVVREGITNHESVSHSINLLKLAKVKILGFFVNDIDLTSMGYSSYSKSYGSRFGRYGRASYRNYNSSQYDYNRGYDMSYGAQYAYHYSYGEKPSKNKAYTESLHDTENIANTANTQKTSNENKQKE